MDFKKILKKEAEPLFKPSSNHLNCDPSLELEEMIVEARPLHKKKKRLAKQRSSGPREGSEEHESQLLKDFIVYNRYKELKRKAMEEKERQWQRELDDAMANSQVQAEGASSVAAVPSNRPTTSSTHNPPTLTTGDMDFIDRSPSPHSTVL